MGDTPVLLGQPDVDSIILGAAEKEGRRLGFTISASAKDLLLQRSLPALNRDNEEGRLESRRAEVERNGAVLIQHIVNEQVEAGSAHQITYQHMLLGISEFCKKHPDFYPVCTKAH